MHGVCPKFYMAVSSTRGPTYSESDSCHSGTLGEIERFKMAAKMAAANVNKEVVQKYGLGHCTPKTINTAGFSLLLLALFLY